ncbi:MAG TPA: sodium:solute symporter, partial [Prolixibacteraceae bacterium]|nr:sodium:solute symporter [Prolixibacteraceae bacterium]
FTGRKATTDTFFIANRKSPWYLVAFAMIGATISGVTFISVPGEVGNSAFSYLQFVMGNVVGYWLVAGFLLPVYYRMNLISIYSFLGERLGKYSHKTGSFFFILSKLIGAAFRLYLAAGVLQIAFFDAFKIPFYVTVIVSIALIWVYTFKGGIKTIVWTDSLQTLFIVGAVVLTIIIISRSMGWDFGTMTREIGASPLSDIFTWDWRSGNNFFKQFFSGIFITLVIVGMDQDSMQKNLTCKSLREARKNMLVFSIAFIVTVFLFLCLGALLYLYAGNLQLQLPAHSDDVYPWLAFNKLGMAVGIAFLIGVIAAAYSSADSALTSLTTTLSIDFLKAEQLTEERRVKVKTRSHLAFSILLILVILAFRAVNDQSVVVAVFTVAGYTYGPILGLFLFGLLTKRKINDRWVPLIAVAAPALSYLISANSEKWLGGYTFGFEILILNGLLMISGLYIISKK